MVRRRRSRKRVAEQQNSYLSDAESQLPRFASTPDEMQRAVERNSIKRGIFFIRNLVALDFDGLLRLVTELASGYDKEEWYADREGLWIDADALRVLDSADPPVPYPYYFCTPEILRTHPVLVMYYRNVGMVSQKVMNDMGLSTITYEAGVVPPLDVARDLTQHFNEIVNALVKATQVTPHRHLEMAYSNLGDSLGGSWRNEVGRLAWVEVITPLAVHLHRQGYLGSISYSLKGAIVESGTEAQGEPGMVHTLTLTDSTDLEPELAVLEEQRLVYRELSLRNGNRLLLNRQITWTDPEGQAHRIGPDLFASSGGDDMLWGGELKGGADPAGSDEHWKTATQAFNRILFACESTGRPKPPLSFIATILVERVAREAAEWIQRGKLESVYNLTQIAEDCKKQQRFLDDLTSFLGCC